MEYMFTVGSGLFNGRQILWAFCFGHAVAIKSEYLFEKAELHVHRMLLGTVQGLLTL
jgi:hypothetical protein